MVYNTNELRLLYETFVVSFISALQNNAFLLLIRAAKSGLLSGNFGNMGYLLGYENIFLQWLSKQHALSPEKISKTPKCVWVSELKLMHVRVVAFQLLDLLQGGKFNPNPPQNVHLACYFFIHALVFS